VFKKASKKQSYLRMALIGPSGSGKTYTSLKLACEIAKKEGTQIALIDSERGSASKYADEFEFDVLELESFHPQRYIDAIEAAGKNGYNVLVVDSLSHAWTGKDGALELVEKERYKSSGGNSFAAWRNVTPLHNDLVDAIVRFPGHIFVTMRSKTEYIQEKDEKGRTQIRKVGLAPVQRDGLEYEFDIVADMNNENVMHVSKSRCSKLTNEVFQKPGADVATTIFDWLRTGIEVKQEIQTEKAKLDKIFGGDDVPSFTESPRIKKNIINLPEAPEDLEVIPDVICENIKDFREFKGIHLKDVPLESVSSIYNTCGEQIRKVSSAKNKQWFELIQQVCTRRLMKSIDEMPAV